jgi:glycosyltransferase involved in cell wall biosynthesis
MRILWIKTELLHPVDKGGRIRSYQMLRSLMQRHHVTYVCLDDGSAASDALTRAQEYAHEVVTVPFRPARKGTPAYLADLLLNLFSPVPYIVARFRSGALRARINRLAATSDLVVCDFLMPSVNVADDLPVPAVLFQHNVEALIWQRRASVPQNALQRAYMQLQWRRVRQYEAAQCRRFSHVVAVSAVDAELMRREYGLQSLSHVETGVDFEYFAAPSDRPRSGLVFVGSMDWMPNADGIRWFAAEVFPQIRAALAEVTLTVVGREPAAALRQLATPHSGITVTGTVPDVRPYLERAAISIVPLRIGGGTRLKIYEAMAMGTPVVATTIGAEGLPVKNGEHLLIADSAATQAAAVIGLLQDRERATRIAASALRFVRAHCSWEGVAEQFLSQCVSLGVTRTLAREDRVA